MAERNATIIGGAFAVDDVNGTARLFVEPFAASHSAPEVVQEKKHAEVVEGVKGMFYLLKKALRRC